MRKKDFNQQYNKGGNCNLCSRKNKCKKWCRENIINTNKILNEKWEKEIKNLYI